MDHWFDTWSFKPLATIEDLSHPFDSFKLNNFDLVKWPESSQVDTRLQLLYPKVNWKYLFYQGKLWWDFVVQKELSQIKQWIQSDFLELHRENQANDLLKNRGYTAKLKECFWEDCLSAEELKVELNKKSEYSREYFEKKIKEMDWPLEVPLIDHVDIILFLASITEVVLNLWIKGWKFILNKTWECLLKTETWTQLIKLKDWGLQVIQRLVEKSKEWIKLLKPKEYGVTPDWVMMAVWDDAVETWISKTVTKSETIWDWAKKWVDFIKDKNSILSNNYMFLREYSSMTPELFNERVYDLIKDLTVKNLRDDDIALQSIEILEGIWKYVVENEGLFNKELSLFALWNLNRVRTEIWIIAKDITIDDTIKTKLVPLLENELTSARNILFNKSR